MELNYYFKATLFHNDDVNCNCQITLEMDQQESTA